MHETSLSLLERFRHSPENESWTRFADLYTPLIRAWRRRYDVQNSDANDLVQEVLLAVSKDLSKFEHRGQLGDFRGWLKAIRVNRFLNCHSSRVPFSLPIEDNSGWAEGDWDGDGDFTSRDFITAFLDGGYEQGPRPATAVPECSSFPMFLVGIAACFVRRRQQGG